MKIKILVVACTLAIPASTALAGTFDLSSVIRIVDGKCVQNGVVLQPDACKNAYTGENNEVITQRQTDVKTISPTTSRYLAMIPSPNTGNVDLKNQLKAAAQNLMESNGSESAGTSIGSIYGGPMINGERVVWIKGVGTVNGKTTYKYDAATGNTLDMSGNIVKTVKPIDSNNYVSEGGASFGARTGAAKTATANAGTSFGPVGAVSNPAVSTPQSGTSIGSINAGPKVNGERVVWINGVGTVNGKTTYKYDAATGNTLDMSGNAVNTKKAIDANNYVSEGGASFGGQRR